MPPNEINAGASYPSGQYNGKARQGEGKIHDCCKSLDQLEKTGAICEDEQHAFDAALEKAGSWGPWQKKFFFIASISQLFSALHCVAAAFLGATPNHWCRIPGFESLSLSEELKNLSIPRRDGGYACCEFYDRDYSSILDAEGNQVASDYAFTNATLACSSWEFDTSIFQSTVVTEWSLICGRKWMSATVQASFMSGLFVGSLTMGQISDRFGRRTTALFSATMMLIIGVVTAFVTDYIVFLVLRFIIASMAAGLMVTNFVNLMEVVKPESRTITGMLNGVPFGMGIALLPAFAYFFRDWRDLQLAISLSSLFLMLYFWILPESPRWLASKGHPKKSLEILKRIAKGNNAVLPNDDAMIQLLSLYKANDDCDSEADAYICIGLVKMFRAQLALVRTPVMRRRCLIQFFAWFTGAMVYYGLTFSGGNIQVNLFLMVFLLGFVEVPGFFFGVVVLNRTGRKLTMASFFIICGTACLVILAVPKHLTQVNLVLASIGKFFNAAVFQLCYLYTSELVPTGVRNIAVGTSSMIARIGSSTAPYIVDLLGAVHYAIPSTVFGVISICAGLLTFLLPETSKQKLPNTIEEVESMSK